MLGIEGKRAPSPKLQFGTAFHAVVEHNANKPVSDWSVREGCAGLDADLSALVAGTAAAYAVHWDGSLKYHATELELVTPLRNPRLELVTVMDGIVEDQAGTLAVIDHKTTESDIRPGSWFWEKLALDPQASAYLWAAREHGYDVQHAIWNAVKRPKLSRRAEATEPEYYVKSGKWGNAGDVKPGTGLQAESSADYAKRVRDTILGEPTEYFQRCDVVRMVDETEAALDDVNAVGEQILNAWDKDQFPRNPSSCFAFGERCSYWELCTGAASPDDDQLFTLRVPRDAKTR